MADTPQFSSVITTTDKMSPVLDAIGKRLGTTMQQLERMPRINAAAQEGFAGVGRAMHMLEEGAPAVFGRLGEAVGAASGHVRRLHGHLRSLWGTLTSALPMLGGLATVGGIGGITGIVAYTESVAKARDETQRLADAIHVSMRTLGDFGFLGRMTGQDFDGIAGSLGKLSVNLGKAESGKDKELARWLKDSKIAMVDKQGHPRDVDAILPDLARVFREKRDSPKLPEFAQLLFGKNWKEMTEILKMPEAELNKLLDQAKKIRISPTKDEAAALKEYNKDWKEIDATIAAIGKSTVFAIAPAAEPLLRSLRDFLQDHRDDIRGWVGKESTAMAEGLKQVDWKAVGGAAGVAFDAAGTALRVIPTALIRIANFLENFARSWLGHAIGFTDPRPDDRARKEPRNPTGYEIERDRTDRLLHLDHPAPRTGAELHVGRWLGEAGDWLRNITAPTPSAPYPSLDFYRGIHPDSPGRGQVDITLRLPYLPGGATVESRSSGSANPVRVDTGLAFGGSGIGP